MADKQHNTLVGADLHQPFRSGTYANIPGTCVVGDWYWATDTGKLYKCLTTNIWTQFSAGSSVLETQVFS